MALEYPGTVVPGYQVTFHDEGCVLESVATLQVRCLRYLRYYRDRIDPVIITFLNSLKIQRVRSGVVSR